MALPVSATMRSRWRSRKHVGTAKPSILVRVGGGHFFRRYDSWEGMDVDAFIKGHTGQPWQAFWTRATPMTDLPGILSCEIDQGFDNNGIATATIQLENVIYKETTGSGGLFHKIKRGWFSPWRGGKLPRPPFDPYGQAVEANPWWQFLNANAQVKVWMGYGDEMVPVFTGLTDELDLTSQPDRITIVARDFGQVLLDQKLFGWVKDKSLRDPIVFADRRSADQVTKVGSNPNASSSAAGYPPKFVLDKTVGTFWASAARSSPDDTEWIQVHIPEGRYEDIYLWPEYEGMECYVSVYGRKVKNVVYGATDDDKRPTIDNATRFEGWLDTGLGTVPGSDGGIPYVQKFTTTARGRTLRLPWVLKTGDNSVIRLSFRKLQRSWIGQKDYPGMKLYRAGVRGFQPVKRTTQKQARQARWVLVDDLADVVKVVLRWAGFKEWDIETTGISLSSPMIVNRQTSMMDVIAKVADLVGYVFFMGPPTNDDLSIGIPTWRRPQLWTGFDVVEEIADRDLLTGIKLHFSDDPLSSIIRVRGKLASAKNGGVELGGGVQPGSRSDRRVQAEYRPPWAQGRRTDGEDQPIDRTAGVVKHVVHIENQYRSEYECKVACVFIAAAEALASATGVVECAGFPGVMIDDAIMVTDTGTGANTRLYLAQKTVTFDAGAQTKWVMSLQGALLDTADTRNLLRDFYAVVGDELEREKNARKVKNTRRQAPVQKRHRTIKKGGRKGK